MAVAALPAQDPVDSAAYLMVIDKSGSMGKRSGGGTRWGAMKERAIGFVETMPSESRLWMALFDSSAKRAITSDEIIASDADRQQAIRRIRNFSIGSPGDSWRTDGH